MIYNLKERFKNRLFLLSFLQGLRKIGIAIIPFYLHREFVYVKLPPSFDLEMKNLSTDFLTPAEIAALADHPEFKSNFGLTEKLWLDENCKCFAAKAGSEIAALVWCSLDRFVGDYLEYKLNVDEAYLFGALTLKKYRGQNLAPFLRYNLYKQLEANGRGKFYSLTEYFNTPAFNFKKKLGAKPVKIFVYLCLFNKFHRNITVKTCKF